MKVIADAVLFDSDGVLVDSRSHVDRAWRQLAAEFELDAELLLANGEGVRAVDTLRHHLPPRDVDAAVARLDVLELGLAESCAALPGALGLLGQLPDDAWAIVTSASRALATLRWRRAGIPLPRRSITADDVGNGKPDPEPYLAAARLLGADPARCVVFEDSPAGGAAGSAAGATVVAVGDRPWAVRPAARVDDLAAVRVRSAAAARPLELIV